MFKYCFLFELLIGTMYTVNWLNVVFGVNNKKKTDFVIYF